MVLAAGIVFLACGVASADNVLSNPDFEVRTADRPARWDLYLMPQEGAYARLESPGHADSAAAVIHVPLPYPENPVNNWSQNIIGAVGGKTFAIKGYIKTQDVHEAGIWVQCWRKRPLTLLDTATTEREMPVFGTTEWQLVETTFTAPAATEFLTVRCVLRGPGTAWFDALSLSERPEAAGTDPAPEAAGAARSVVPPVPDSVDTPPPSRTATLPEGTPQAATAPAQDAQTDSALQYDLMLETNRSLVMDLDDLRQSNEALLDEVLRLRDEVGTLRAQLESYTLEETPLPAENTPELPVPPLVPAGKEWETRQ